MWNLMCVWFLSFFLTSDVSTLKKMNIVKIIWWVNWLTREQKDRLLTRCRRFEKENRQLTVVVTNSLTNWFSKQENLQLSRFVKICFVASFTKIRSVTSWFFQRIWIERQVKYIHRLQRKNFTKWRFSFDSRISTSDSTIFFWFAYFYEWFDDFL